MPTVWDPCPGNKKTVLMIKKLSKIIAQSLKMEKSACSHNLDNTEKCKNI